MRKPLTMDTEGTPVFVAATAVRTLWLVASPDPTGELQVVHKLDTHQDDRAVVEEAVRRAAKDHTVRSGEFRSLVTRLSRAEAILP